MSIGLIFWIIMILWLLAWLGARFGPGYPWAPYADWVMLFLLFLCLGWRVFGAPIHG